MPFAAPRTIDPRVLKSQLDVIAAIDRSSWIVTPVWALILGLMVSDVRLLASHATFRALGDVPLRQALFFPVVVVVASYVTYGLYVAYRREAPQTPARLAIWNRRFLTAQIGVSAAWGLLPWLLWEPGNVANHLFLLMAVATTMASLLVSRLGSMTMLTGGMVPIVTLTSLRFLATGDALDAVFAILTPAYAFHLYIDGKRFIHALRQDVRLRLKVEDMAAALTRARDEALTKRYEAETANAAKSAFLANMSHELRTPLNAILGFSEIIAERAMGPEALERYCGYARDIHSSGAHLLSLINDLLDVAKIEAGKMEIDPRPIDPRSLMEAVGRLMASRFAARQQNFTIVPAPDLPLLVADERAVKQMLLNLISNAVKFTPPGGNIALTCGMSRAGGMEFCVDDDGPGIAPEKLARVFQPFSQIDNRFDREAGGTGLGLALVQGLAELHGGSARLESRPGHGTRAYLYFPSTLEASPRREIA
jgi:two-component system cell cycle sensor histidine kinase PleC